MFIEAALIIAFLSLAALCVLAMPSIPSIPPLAFVIPMDTPSPTYEASSFQTDKLCFHGECNEYLVPSTVSNWTQHTYAGNLLSTGPMWKNSKPQAFSTIVCADQLCLFYGQLVVPFVHLSSLSGPSTIYVAQFDNEYSIHQRVYYGAVPESSGGREPTGAQVRFQPSKVEKNKQPLRAKLSSKQLNDEGSLVKVGHKPKKNDKDRRYGCPFSKHNPRRYESVCGRACTHPPGLKAKRIIEHLRRVHSCVEETKCKYCGQPWRRADNDAERLEELQQHFPGRCTAAPDDIRSQPEYMNPAQEEVIGNFERDINQSSSDERWVFLYMRLFPGAPIPSPQYDYFIPSHHTTSLRHPQIPTQDDCLFGAFTARRTFPGQPSSSDDDTGTELSPGRSSRESGSSSARLDNTNLTGSNWQLTMGQFATGLNPTHALHAVQVATELQGPPRPLPQAQTRSALNIMPTSSQPTGVPTIPSSLISQGGHSNRALNDNMQVLPTASSAGASAAVMAPVAGSQTIPPFVTYQSPDSFEDIRDTAANNTGVSYEGDMLRPRNMLLPQQSFLSHGASSGTESFDTPTMRAQTSFETDFGGFGDFGAQEDGTFGNQPQAEGQLWWRTNQGIWQPEDFDFLGNLDGTLERGDLGDGAPDDSGE